MVYFRRQLFKKKFTNIVEAELSRRVAEKLNAPIDVKVVPWWKRIFYLFTGRSLTQHSDYGERSGSTTPPRVRTDMIRRTDDKPKPINPSGWISEVQSPNPNQDDGSSPAVNGQNGYPPVGKAMDMAMDEMEREGPEPLVMSPEERYDLHHSPEYSRVDICADHLLRRVQAAVGRAPSARKTLMEAPTPQHLHEIVVCLLAH